MQHSDSVMGALIVAAAGWFAGNHLPLTPEGVRVVHVVTAVLAIGVLLTPFLR